MRAVTQLVIHCSATKANVDENITLPGEDIGAREIRRWHQRQGYSDIGYHYVIRRDGRVEIGRPLERARPHD